ncbi:MAG TPA: SpoIIE family protein phosphatase [Mycobacteriales bacterium]|nr:SpoIIE family protein phosphatase [Mycobacteriales bacterium]
MRAGLTELLRDPARLDALHRLRLLEPDTAGTFERVGRLAARLLGVPVAGVNFVDAVRQFAPGTATATTVFAAAQGASVPAGEGFCPVTLVLGQPLCVPDARADPEFANDPTVRRLGLVAYVGVPLFSAGQPVGTLCAAHTGPMPWTAQQRSSLQDLAGLIMDELELRTRLAERRVERARAEATDQARLLRAVMRQMPEGLVVTRAPDGEVTAANDEFRRLVGHELLPAVTIEDYQAYPLLYPDGTPYPPREMPVARALLNGEVVAEEEVRYQRPNGEVIDLLMRAAPVRDERDDIVAAVGIVTDISRRKRVEQTLRMSQERLAFLAEASSLVASSLEPQVIIDRLGRLVVDRLVDWCAIVEPDPHGRLRRVAMTHRDSARRALAERWLALPPYDVGSDSGLVVAYREHRTVRLVVNPAPGNPWPAGPLAGPGGDSVVAVPLVAGGERLGAMGFGRQAGQPAFDDQELALASEVAGRFAVALAHARRFEAERGAAEILQRSLLPELSELDAVEIGAVYVPSSRTLAIGGDFYDVLDLGGRRAGLAVGDVMGHGVRAAAVMGQVRAALRAYARLGLRPAAILATLDELVTELPDGMLVTCLYGVYDVPAGELRLASAGHLAPFLRLPPGEPRVLEVAPGPPLGVGRSAYTESVHAVPAGRCSRCSATGWSRTGNAIWISGWRRWPRSWAGTAPVRCPRLRTPSCVISAAGTTTTTTSPCCWSAPADRRQPAPDVVTYTPCGDLSLPQRPNRSPQGVQVTTRGAAGRKVTTGRGYKGRTE